eukprot:298102_1
MLTLPWVVLTVIQVSSEFYSTNDCNYYTPSHYPITQSQQIVTSIMIESNKINIEFDIKLAEYCDAPLCNILNLSSNDHIESLSLSINGMQNYFEISIINEHNNNHIYRISNASNLLPVDGVYHHINLFFVYPVDLSSHVHSPNKFQIDDTEYYYHSTSLIPSKSFILFNVTHNHTYILYLGNANDISLNATLQNICLKVSEFVAEINCSQTATATLTSVSDIDYYHFNFSNNNQISHIMFDSCGSMFDTYLYLWDIHQGIFINHGDDDGNCGNREQLIVYDLPTGEYILIVSGYGSVQNHDYGQYQITVYCFDSGTEQNKGRLNDYLA